MSYGLHHLQNRKRARARPLSFIDRIIYCAAILSPLALAPQVLHLFITKNASSFYLPTWLLLGCINGLWVMYGIQHRERPIVLTNALLALLNFIIVVGILFYR